MTGNNVRFPCRQVPEDPHVARLLGLYSQRQEGQWMQRLKVLGGHLTAQQWRGLADIVRQSMLDWTGEDVERYTREHSLPYNKLYDFVSPYGERFTVIGCTCCHIPIRESVDPRAGKFP